VRDLLRILVAIILSFHFQLTQASECLENWPYGFNGLYPHLIADETFCISYGHGQIDVLTDTLGRRIIGPKSSTSAQTYAFGDSQLLGYDDDSHHLLTLAPQSTLVLHAAPNNGPYEYLSWYRVSQLDSASHIIFGFNLSTDIFRILPGWKPKDHILLDSASLRLYYDYPLLHYLKGMATVFSDKPKVSLKAVEAGSAMAERFVKLTENQLREAADQLGDVFQYSLEQRPSPDRKAFLIYQPFWASKLNFKDTLKLSEFARYLGCVINRKTGATVLFAAPESQSESSLSLDRRHWRQSSLAISHLQLSCSG